MSLESISDPAQQHAYRVGYRMGLNGRAITDTPSYVVQNAELLKQFQLGWQEGYDQLLATRQDDRQYKRKLRLTWFVIMVLGGLATSGAMIDSIEQEKKSILPVTAERPLGTLPVTKEHQNYDDYQLSLLSDEARADLNYLQKQQQNKIQISEAPLEPTTLVIEQSQLSAHGQKLENQIGKHIRELSWQALVTPKQSVKNMEIKWIWQDELIQSSSVSSTDSKGEISDKIQLSSAWQGRWRLELWQNNQPIYREYFDYGYPSQ